MINDISSSAAALYDGGWRSTDFEQLQAEYSLDADDAKAICTALAQIELKNKND